MSPRLVTADDARAFLEKSAIPLVVASEREQGFAHTVVVQAQQIEQLVDELGDIEAYDSLKSQRDGLKQQLAEVEAELVDAQNVRDDLGQRLQAVRSLCTAATVGGVPLSHRRIYEATRGNYS